jgi:hypothetical protein
MVRAVRSFQVSVPTTATIAAPFTQPLAMPAWIVRVVRVRVPPGPRGLMGWRLTSGGQAMVPDDPTQWIVADDETFTWQLEGAPEGDAWQLQGYNLGRFAHVVYLTLECDPLGSGDSAPIVYIPDAQVGGGSSGGGVSDPGSPGTVTPDTDGAAAAQANALAALQATFGDDLGAAPVPVPQAPDPAATEYDDAKGAILAALDGIGSDGYLPAAEVTDGASVADQNARVALRRALGIPGDTTLAAVPLPSTQARAAYDARKAAILVALRGM